MPSFVLNTSNQTLYYSTEETVIRNAVGKISATLIEYVITTDQENASQIYCKLYKTKEGFWYDPATPDEQIDNKTKHNLKAAIDDVENKSIASRPFHL